MTLEDTVGYFKLYQDLMNFWEQQYAGQIYHLDYDRLTVEQETETRQLIEYLELGWEDACLSPQENKRSVRTASQQQVREKVYTGSSDAWRKFEPYLMVHLKMLMTMSINIFQYHVFLENFSIFCFTQHCNVKNFSENYWMIFELFT